ncbi:unnamed protein product [Paramecium sonneborni]|uniref:EF-hand domain-containing protein n=1 Tax=Paramecium sonneborni TaxID=65129 RepID=A0A8S1MZ04_9CILI|nr:unnamed protein product [Paramecium sonneborni]
MNFCEFIQLTVESEDKLEEIRIKLAKLEMFELNTVYKRLDQPRKNAMTAEQIIEFLIDNNVKFTEEELNYIFRVLDTDGDNIITLQDFQYVILPKTNDQVKDQALNHKSYEMPKSMLLPKEVEATLTDFFKQLQQNYNLYQQIQQPININELNIFENENLITLESLKNWLQTIEREIDDQVLEKFLIIIDGNPNNLQNLIDQIQQQQIEQPNSQPDESIKKSQEQIREQPQQEQTDVQDIKQSQEDLQKSYVQNQNQEQSNQKTEQQQDQIAQSKLLLDSQPYSTINPLLNYYEQQIREEEFKIKQLCDELNIPNIYTQKRDESLLIKYYEKEIAREQEILNNLSLESRLSDTQSRYKKSTFTPDPLYLDQYQNEIIRINDEIRKEANNLSLLQSKIEIESKYGFTNRLQNSFLMQGSPTKFQESYLCNNFSGEKRQFCSK